MVNFCSECGTQLVGTRRFCTQCGHRVPESPSTLRDAAMDETHSSEEPREPGSTDPSALAFAAALVATGASGGDVGETLRTFTRWQEQPRGPSLKTDLGQFFVPTGRDLQMAEQFEALLDRNELVMGPAGRNAATDRSQWDYYNGIWSLASGDGFPIDAWFGRSALNGEPAVTLLCDLLLPSTPPGPDTDPSWLSSAAETMWSHAVCFAENSGFGFDPFGQFGGPGYFQRHPDRDRPVRGVLTEATDNFRYVNASGRGIAWLTRPLPNLRLWYMIDVPLHRADDVFLEVADVMIQVQQTLLSDSQVAEGVTVATGMSPIVCLAGNLSAMERAGVVDEVMTA